MQKENNEGSKKSVVPVHPDSGVHYVSTCHASAEKPAGKRPLV
jgi:hypothetical protein